MNYEQFKTKTSYLFIFLIGFVIGGAILAITYAQEPTIRIPTTSYQSNGTTGTVEKGGSETGLTDTGNRSNVELTETSKRTEYRKDTGSKEITQRPIQPILRTGDKKVLVKGFPEDSQATKIATYAYKISNGDIDFLMTLKAENGGFNMYQQSNVYTNGKREESYGLCQLMRKRHKEVDTKEFWESWEYQVDVCYRKYVGGTRFYGYDVRLKFKNDFTILD